MSLIKEIREICRKYQIKPLRRRGQNFLINPKICAKIIEAADLTKDDVVLEIGAGLGTLTKELAKKANKVIAVEIDKKLAEILKKQVEIYRNIRIVGENILKFQVRRYKLANYKIVANLPYNITGAVLRKFLASESPKPSLMVLMLQKEVAQRICAQPPKMNLLATVVQFYGQPKIISYISRNNFWPKPKVDSAILKISNFRFPISNIDEQRFLKIVKAGFSAPRKYLLNNLIKNGIIKKEEGQKIFEKLNFNLKIRAQELGVEEWIRLMRNL